MGYIKEEVLRLNSMVTHFLEFARSRPPELQTLGAQRLMEEICKVLSEFVAPRDVTTHCSPPSFPCSVSVDLGQVRGLILNLVLHAVEAMPTRSGVVDVSAALQNGHIVVSVTDEGTGIPEEKLHHIFEPFYTTKPEGTGLGSSDRATDRATTRRPHRGQTKRGTWNDLLPLFSMFAKRLFHGLYTGCAMKWVESASIERGLTSESIR